MIRIIQLILALSFLVVIHELGHFTFARIFGVRVEKFYLFFNYRFSLVRIKRFGGRWHVRFLAANDSDEEWNQHPESTEWGIGWIPFGGYCAISGMVDETQSADQLSSEKQPWEFRSKNVFQRFFIIAGGIMVNFVAGMLIFGMLFFHWGSSRLPLSHINTGLYYSDMLLSEGFEQQDKVLTINGVEPETIGDIVEQVIIEGKRDVVVLRGQDTVALTMSEDLGNRYLAFQNEYDRQQREIARRDPSYQKSRFVLISEFYPFVVDSVFEGTAAYYAQLQVGDTITAISGVPTPCHAMVMNELQRHPCDSVTIDYVRMGEEEQTAAFLGDQCRLGVMTLPSVNFFELETKEYGFWESLVAGWHYGCDYLKMYVKQFRLVFSKEGAQSLGGFGAIGQMFPKSWDWASFWHMTAVLSLILAFMNFLPIPALDGGYLLFLLVEMITRKQPSDRFLERANQVGWYILLALLILANGNDLLKLFF